LNFRNLKDEFRHILRDWHRPPHLEIIRAHDPQAPFFQTHQGRSYSEEINNLIID
jgi:hypothetical protein